jgi:two-component system chemotaxis response regulator CheY
MANIMIVDDSPIIRRSLRGMLESLGHRIAAEAEDGNEAIDIYKENEIDLVTMDIQLPGINGIEAVRLIRERNPQAAIVMISSIEERSKVYEAIKQGAKHYIIKPFTEDKVKKVINAVLGVQPNLEQNAPVESVAEPQGKTTDRFAKEQKQLELKVPALAAMPFELVVKDGRVVLIVQRHISDANVSFLCSCLQGLLYYRKAKYVIELWEPIRHDEGLRLLIDFVSAVRDRKGTVGVVATDPTWFTQLSAKLRSGVYRSYAEIEW